MIRKKRFCLAMLILFVILCLQAFVLTYFGVQKKGFHIDEMATYTLSNGGFISRRSEWLMNTWVDGDRLFDTLSASGEERFDYQTVYHVQESDVHPPLYYYMMHTMSSLVPGRFSKWLGIAPNIVFCLLTSVLLFFISRRFLKNDFLALIAVSSWAFSIGAADTATFIRMYAMLTFFVVLFTFLHIKALDQTLAGRKIPAILFCLLFLCTVSGLLTQYYFSVFALFLCGFFLIYLIIAKRWREIAAYLLAEFGAIGAAVAYYPTMLVHIFGGSFRGQQAFDNLRTSAFSKNAKIIFQALSSDMFGGWLKWLLVLIVLLLAVAVLRKFFVISAKNENGMLELRVTKIRSLSQSEAICFSIETAIMAIIGIVIFLYTILIVKVAPYQENRYYLCLYPLLSVCAVYMLHRAFQCAFQNHRASCTATLLLTLFIVVCGLLTQKPDYLYPEFAERINVLQHYCDKPAIVLHNAYDWHPSLWLTEYNNYPAVYINVREGDFSCLEDAAATKDLSDGVVIYSLRFSQSDEEFFENVRKYLPVKSYEKLCDGSERVFFCTLSE